MKGLDFSWARPGGAVIKANGFHFVLRYTPYPGDGGKGLTLAEIEDYRANGLDIGLVFESTDGRMFNGYPAGVQDAIACQNAIVKLNLPTNMVFYFACDRDLIPSMFPYIDDYMAGANSILGIERSGIYGEYEVVKHCHENGITTYLWQTYAWSGGDEYEYRHLYQYSNGEMLNGSEVDYCESYGEDQGLWKAEGDEFEVNKLEWENTKLRLFAGSEYANNGYSREERLARADAEIANADKAQSINDILLSVPAAVKSLIQLARSGQLGDNIVTDEELANVLEKIAGDLRKND